MKKRPALSAIIFFLAAGSLSAQPFVDLVNASYQGFQADYKDPADTSYLHNKTNNIFLNLFLPKEFKNGNVFMFRINSETINSTAGPQYAYSYRLSAVSLPLGFKFVTKNKKWETILIGIPKLASDFSDKISSYDFQYGGIFLQHYVHSDKLKIKAGLYYNREAFGNFFVPLVGVDWKINDRIYIYGIIPTNYRAEINILKQKLYTGINFKSYTRSFRLSKSYNHDYVRYDEMQLKLFVDYFVYSKLLVFAEAGYSIGKNPLQYKYDTAIPATINAVYTKMKSYPVFNIGLAYRIRMDFENKQ